MMQRKIANLIIAKVTVRGVSSLGGLALIVGGIYMCVQGLSASGIIDLKSAFLEGKIETGSIGLMSMFLGVVLLVAINVKNRQQRGSDSIKISIDGDRIDCEGFSHTKLATILEMIMNEKKESRSNVINDAKEKAIYEA